jgi:hypothetical protein
MTTQACHPLAGPVRGLRADQRVLRTPLLTGEGLVGLQHLFQDLVAQGAQDPQLVVLHGTSSGPGVRWHGSVLEIGLPPNQFRQF